MPTKRDVWERTDRLYQCLGRFLYVCFIAILYEANAERDLYERFRPSLDFYSRFLRDVTAAMLLYRTIARKVFWEFDYIIMQNLNNILPLFCTPTWPSHYVSEN